MRSIDVDCEFCRIINGSAYARVVCQTDVAVAFLPLTPAVLGHTLVVPKRHVTDLWNVDESLAGLIMQAAVRVSNAVRVALDPDGLNLISSVGEAASQTVFHLHFHIVPRWHHDRIGRIWPPSVAYRDDVKDEIAERIRHACE
ncbi:MAG: HIT family protein [Chloroflexi bacterium]|nr:MAG: HIT family protein [Chloroflexota bacterium]